MKELAKLRKITYVCMLLLFNACGEKNEPKPMGTLISYTNLRDDHFDRIDILVDGKVRGFITKPTTDKPVCWAENSATVSSISLEAGRHTVAAKQYLAGEMVGEWDEDAIDITLDKCNKIRWTE
ncbi:hypothetical protein [Dyadobacter crusticola]|uniref:hypothetical protein n=1 Tax=Dyadobacter crusticola TaxID=292407 RepID=UPI0004E16920|nr:hypothetical protein [Dyadobacter crusticola]